MDKKRFDECLQFYYGNGRGKFWVEKAKEWEYDSKETLRSQFHTEREKRNLPTKEQKEKGINYIRKGGIKKNKDRVSEKLLEMSDEQSWDEEFLLRAHGFDPEKFEIVTVQNELAESEWTYGEAFRFSSKISAKIKEVKITHVDVAKIFAELPAPTHPKAGKMQSYSLDGKVLEINLADLHYGALLVSENLTYKEKVEKLVEEIIARVGSQKISKIYFVLNGDTLHFDTAGKTTSRGTPIFTVGSSPQQLFKEVIDLIIWAILRLSTLAPVETFYIKGNHDALLGYALIVGLELYFRNNERVTIDTNDAGRIFRLIGVTLVGWTHGNMPKKNLLHLLQTECRDLWGKSKYAELHIAHYHHEVGSEENGLMLRYLNSTISPDGWHFDNGYTDSSKATNCFLWDLETGLDSTWTIYV